MLSVINQAYYPLLLADATAKTCPLCSGNPATSAHSKPGLADPLGIWGSTGHLAGDYQNLILKGQEVGYTALASASQL